LETDLSEQNNLAQINLEKTSELINMLELWRTGINAPIPEQINPKYVSTK